MNKLVVLQNYIKTKYFNKFKSRKELLKWQDKEVKKFLKNIYKKSEFYKNLYNGLDINNWQNFPIISKAEYVENFDSINTVGISKQEAFEHALKAETNRDFSPTINGITVGLSSGTSGNRGLFLVSDYERAFWAGNILSKILPNSIFKKNKIAFFLRANSNLYESVKNGNIEFRYFDLLTPIEVNLSALNDYSPTIIVAPPSMLKILANSIYDGYLKVVPRKIISVAEVLDDLDKVIIEKAFGMKIQQIYQATEGFLGTTCEYGHFHINEDLIAIQKEYIDKENGKFIPIITDFHRISQPIIRYRLNDILTELKTPCPCGSNFLAISKIEGRCDDIFYLESLTEKNSVPIFPDFLSRAIIFSSEKITDYKVIQEARDLISIYINYNEESIKQEILNRFEQLFKTYNCKQPQIVFVDTCSKEAGKKFKHIESRVQ